MVWRTTGSGQVAVLVGHDVTVPVAGLDTPVPLGPGGDLTGNGMGHEQGAHGVSAVGFGSVTAWLEDLCCHEEVACRGLDCLGVLVVRRQRVVSGSWCAGFPSLFASMACCQVTIPPECSNGQDMSLQPVRKLSPHPVATRRPSQGTIGMIAKNSRRRNS